MISMIVHPARSIAEIVEGGYRVRVWEYLKEGWRVFLQYPIGFLAFAFIAIALSEATEILFPNLGSVFSLVVFAILPAGLALVVWQLMSNRTATLIDFMPDARSIEKLILCQLILVAPAFGWIPIFLLFKHFSSLTGALVGVVVGIAGGIGVVFLIVCFTFTYLLIVERRMKVLEGLKASYLVVRKNWLGASLLTILMFFAQASTNYIGEFFGEWVINNWLPEFFPRVTIGAMPYLKFLGEPFSAGIEGVSYDLGVLMVMRAGSTVGAIIAGCVLAVAYADIFGLSRNGFEPEADQTVI